MLIAAPAAAEKQVDFVVLLDTSKGMFDSFEQSVDLLVEEVLKKQLGAEDRFHLLSFQGTPEFEIERTLTDKTAVKEVLSRLLLLQPLGSHCDIVAALKYATEYVDELPLHSTKKILLLTQGSHEPSPDSAYQDEEENIDRIETLSSYIKRNGWDLNIVEFPRGDNDEAGEGSERLLQHLADSLKVPVVEPGEDTMDAALQATGAVEISYPSEAVVGRRNLSLPLTFTNHSHETKTVVLGSITVKEKELLDERVSITVPPDKPLSEKIPLTLPEIYAAGSHELELHLHTETGGPVYPKSALVTFEIREKGTFGGLGEYGKYIIFGVLFLLILIPLFLIVRRIFAGTGDEEERVGTRGSAGVGVSDEPDKAGGAAASARRVSEAAGAGRSAFTGKGDKRSAPSAEKAGAEAGREKAGGTELSASGKRAGEESLLGEAAAADKKRLEGSQLGETAAEGKKQKEERSTASNVGANTSNIELKKPEEETSRTEDILSSGRKKESGSERADALSAYRKRSTGGADHASSLAAFKAGEATGGAKSKAALGFTGEAFKKRKAQGEIPVELRVDFQHHTPGHNLGWFKDGEERSIGGPGSGADFVITTIPVEGIIAAVRRKGENFFFEPKGKEYFPEYHAHEGENVLYKRIRVRSPETERVTNFSLRKWAPTTERLNRYLHMIDEPGTPKEDSDPE